MRTHTTGLSARTISKLKDEDLPAKFFALGRCFRNETMDYVDFQLTTSFAYWGIVFDVTQEDCDGGDALHLVARKALAANDYIRVDYFLILPMGNGENYPQDVAHVALRDITQERRLFNR